MNKKIYILSYQIDYAPSITLGAFTTLEQAEKMIASRNDWEYGLIIHFVDTNQLVDDSELDYKLYDYKGQLINEVIDGKEAFYYPE